MREQEIARQTTPAIIGVDGNRQDFGFVRRHSRHCKADRLSSQAQAVNQRVALGQHALEFAFAPAAME